MRDHIISFCVVWILIKIQRTLSYLWQLSNYTVIALVINQWFGRWKVSWVVDLFLVSLIKYWLTLFESGIALSCFSKFFDIQLPINHISKMLLRMDIFKPLFSDDTVFVYQIEPVMRLVQVVMVDFVVHLFWKIHNIRGLKIFYNLV